MTVNLRRARLWPSRIFGIFAILAIAASACHAQSRIDEDVDDTDKAWTEMAALLPAAPAVENLLPFYVSPTTTQTFAIDAKSISVDANGVVRFTLVATSSSGAKNISHEGIRCDIRQKKMYAFGHPDGSWSRARRDQWEPININAANRQHAALAEDYLCSGGMVAGKAADIAERIRWKRSLKD